CAFLIEGALKTLIPAQWVQRWLSQEAGVRGVLLGVLAGALTPGGPYTSFPIALILIKAGAGVGTIVAYLTAWSLLSFTRYPMEIAFVGYRLVVLRFLLTAWVPPVIGLLAHYVATSSAPLSRSSL
ncbi:MAG: permease, partial [Armatimonadetes bacterium]|nr:permease [Armatimonadota bacterium]MDW8122900.1 permease [Armatimonadota bacterium]